MLLAYPAHYCLTYRHCATQNHKLRWTYAVDRKMSYADTCSTSARSPSASLKAQVQAGSRGGMVPVPPSPKGYLAGPTNALQQTIVCSLPNAPTA